MEIFGLQKSFAHSYSKLSSTHGYIFLFESEPAIDVENTSYSQLLEASDSVLVVNTVKSVDYRNISIFQSTFIPKNATMLQVESARSVRQVDNSLGTVLPKHLVYSPNNILVNGDETTMKFYEASSYKLDSDFNKAAISIPLTLNQVVEYVFDNPITVDCFVSNRAMTLAVKLEAFVEGEWISINPSFTAPAANSALRFNKLTSSRFRYSQLYSGSANDISWAYFGLIDYTEADIITKQFNFVKGIFCPSLRISLSNVITFCTTSVLDNAGYKPHTCPCMVLDVSTSDRGADILLSPQVNGEERMGLKVVMGYVV